MPDGGTGPERDAPGRESPAPPLLPTFLLKLADPGIRNVLLAGCGGGFDFVHGLLLFPELSRLGKRVSFLSFSFGDPREFTGPAPVVFDAPPALARRVTAATGHSGRYAPEIHLCSLLDERDPPGAPHAVHACCARDFAVPTLTRLYRRLVGEHSIDAVVLVDGGSDSLVVGDERGLGDPVEDAVSVQSVAALAEVPLRILLCAGMGVDRHNGVSDAATLRAVADLTRHGAFLGALALEPGSAAHRFHADAVRHIEERQGPGSLVAHAIVDAARGHHGRGRAEGRLSPGSVFLTPMMAMLWAFDVPAVAARSMVGAWIREARTPAECHAALREGRRTVRLRSEEDERLPAPEPWPLAPLYDEEAPEG